MKILIKLGILLAMMLSSLFGLAQSQSNRLYDMFEGKDGVVSIGFSKSVIKPFEVFIDEDTKKVIYNMEKIRFMSYNEKKGDLDAYKGYERFQKELKGSGYFEIDPEEINSKDANIDLQFDDEVKLIGHGKKDIMDEFHIVTFDNELCLIFSFYGKITIEDIKEFGRFSHSTRGVISM